MSLHTLTYTSHTHTHTHTIYIYIYIYIYTFGRGTIALCKDASVELFLIYQTNKPLPRIINRPTGRIQLIARASEQNTDRTRDSVCARARVCVCLHVSLCVSVCVRTVHARLLSNTCRDKRCDRDVISETALIVYYIIGLNI